MKKNIDSILNEINDGKNLDINLPKFCETLITNYYEYALIHLTMNYFTLYEVVKDKENPEVKNVKKLMKSIHDVMNISFLSEFDAKGIEDSIIKLQNLRNDIINRMQILTTYTDILQNYEYVLNRIESKFQDITDFNQETVINEIASYIFATKDNMIINEKIKEVIGQLPVRMAKTKYFELLSNSLSIYKGSSKSSVESYIYILKTSAMLYKPEGIETDFQNLSTLVKDLEKTDYKNLDQKSYHKLDDKLRKGAGFIQDSVDIYVALIEIVNNLYAILLSIPYILKTDEAVETVCKDILRDINKRFRSKEFQTELDELIDKIVITEGKQEDLAYYISMYEGLLYEINQGHKQLLNSLMLEKIFNSINICQKLLSTSLFVELVDTKEDEVADDLYIMKETKSLIEELKDSFSQRSTPINRAVMANTINKMPVFFNNSNEVMQYILNSLTGCTDEAEKIASINIIRQLME